MSHHCNIVLDFSALNPAEQHNQLLQLAAAIHKDACKVTKDTINTVLHALSKSVLLKKQGSIVLLLSVAKEAEAKDCEEEKEHQGEAEHKGEGKGKGKGKGEGEEEEKSEAEEGKEEKMEMSEEEKSETEVVEEEKSIEEKMEKPRAELVELVQVRKGKCKIQSEEEGEEEEKMLVWPATGRHGGVGPQCCPCCSHGLLAECVALA